MKKKYIIGIDLGTTNCVVAYTLRELDEPQIELLPIPQLVAPSTHENRSSLPSFLYFPSETELSGTAYTLPEMDDTNDKTVVGEIARRRSAEVPDRTVSAAKSWLCHTRVDRRDAILPWNAPAETPKISPLCVTQKYLEHLKKTWDHKFPKDPLAQQEIVLTVPASFDASARELTREAAIAAGFPEQNMLFLEEPQAAIYAWLGEVGDAWRKTLKLGDSLLVCDVGGGTTDLTLIGVEEENGELVLKRIAVGNHLLVGGDNMDLTLAHHAAELFDAKGTKLDPWQSVALWHSSRAAKEILLATGENVVSSPETYPISIPGRGSRLIGGTISVDLDRKHAEEILRDGFFPVCDITAKPKRRSSIGFTEIGLPFEHDTAITKHLGAFLSSHETAPTHVLLNGGVFKAVSLRDRLFEVLENWFPNEKPRHLQTGAGLDHSVARGAAHYGWTKHAGGMRIRGGTARSYYVGIETVGLAIPGAPRPLKALCIAPMGMEEGESENIVTGEIGLIVGETAHFRIFSSTLRKDDRPGQLLEPALVAELQETDSMEKEFTDSDAKGNEIDGIIPISFRTHVTELGILELWCDSALSEKNWKLEFSVREE